MWVLVTYRQLLSLCQAEPLILPDDADTEHAGERLTIHTAVYCAQRQLVRQAAAAGILDKVRDFAARNGVKDVVRVIDDIALGGL